MPSINLDLTKPAPKTIDESITKQLLAVFKPCQAQVEAKIKILQKGLIKQLEDIENHLEKLHECNQLDRLSGFCQLSRLNQLKAKIVNHSSQEIMKLWRGEVFQQTIASIMNEATRDAFRQVKRQLDENCVVKGFHEKLLLCRTKLEKGRVHEFMGLWHDNDLQGTIIVREDLVGRTFASDMNLMLIEPFGYIKVLRENFLLCKKTLEDNIDFLELVTIHLFALDGYEDYVGTCENILKQTDTPKLNESLAKAYLRINDILCELDQGAIDSCLSLYNKTKEVIKLPFKLKGISLDKDIDSDVLLVTNVRKILNEHKAFINYLEKQIDVPRNRNNKEHFEKKLSKVREMEPLLKEGNIPGFLEKWQKSETQNAIRAQIDDRTNKFYKNVCYCVYCICNTLGLSKGISSEFCFWASNGKALIDHSSAAISYLQDKVSEEPSVVNSC